MTSEPVRTRSFVMVLAAWLALSGGLVAALGTAPAAAFALMASGLVALVTLRFSAGWGGLAALLSVGALLLAQAAGPAPPWAIGPEWPDRLVRTLTRWQTLVPDLLTVLQLFGTAACAELASIGLEWDLVLRRTVRENRSPEAAPGPRLMGEAPDEGRQAQEGSWRQAPPGATLRGGVPPSEQGDRNGTEPRRERRRQSAGSSRQERKEASSERP